jgi:hypothetical protein
MASLRQSFLKKLAKKQGKHKASAALVLSIKTQKLNEQFRQ